MYPGVGGVVFSKDPGQLESRSVSVICQGLGKYFIRGHPCEAKVSVRKVVHPPLKDEGRLVPMFLFYRDCRKGLGKVRAGESCNPSSIWKVSCNDRGENGAVSTMQDLFNLAKFPMGPDLSNIKSILFSLTSPIP